MTATRPGRPAFSLQGLCALALVVVCPILAMAQETAKEQGVSRGNYNIQMTVELGWHFTDFNGNRPLSDTFVNVHTGPRLLEQTLEMHSLDHRGLIFDNLSVRSFGYGGDANTYTRLRAYKNKWYNFNAEFRRDKNTWDYNLLANPLNSLTSVPSVPVQQSPHRFDTVRRMADFNLKIAPQSRISLRLGYMRREHEGPSFSTFHIGILGTGVETLLVQPMHSISNRYLIGADLKLLPRTNISVDQFLDFQHGDTSWMDGNATFNLPNGEPVDLGLVFINNFSTCSPLFVPAGSSTANPLCNGFLSYSRIAPTRTSFPTTQVGFQSRYFRQMDLSGRVAHSSGNSHVRIFNELFQGLIVPTDERQIISAANSKAQRLLIAVDFGAVWRVHEKLRILETFRFSNFRIPGITQTATSTLFGNSLLIAPNAFSALSCPAPYNAATCPKHSAVSPADEESNVFTSFLGENTKSQQLQLEYDFTNRAGARIGYRYLDRLVVTRLLTVTESRFYPDQPDRGACIGLPLDANGVCNVSSSVNETDKVAIHENTFLAGIWVHPVDTWRTNFDLEWSSADNSYTRISPRQHQHYRFRTSYIPSPGVNLSFAFKIDERGNNALEIGNLQHFQNYNFNTTLALYRSLSLDLGYEYSNVHTETDVCLTSSDRPTGAVPCTLGIALFHQNSFYDSRSHFGHFALDWKPGKRVNADIGYDLTSENGNALLLNASAPSGSLRYNFHQPSARLTIQLLRSLAWKGQWGYHGYNEKGAAGPVTARDFRGNVVTASLRYAF